MTRQYYLFLFFYTSTCRFNFKKNFNYLFTFVSVINQT